MNFIISASTDVGTTKKTNQDSLLMQSIKTGQGQMVLAVLCDGMGGLEKGEVASAALIHAFRRWSAESLPILCQRPLIESEIRTQWEAIVLEQNQKIQAYGRQQGISLGTTVLAMLMTEEKYYILNVGDCRAYELTDGIRQLTSDQTYVAREIAAGRMTPEQAKTDPYRNVLLQCCGASEYIYPEMLFGETKQNGVYLLCSDGFRHEITDEEIFQRLQPGNLLNYDSMEMGARELIERNKQRMERDNISAALVRTF